MIENIIKCLGFPLLCMSFLGLVSLKKQKLIPITVILITIIFWRSFSRHSSSRYYSIIIFWGLFLSLAAFNFLIKRKKHKSFGIILVLVILSCQLIKLSCSFNNIYVFDYLASINFFSRMTQSPNRIFYDRKIGRSELINPNNRRNIFVYPFSGNDGLFSMFCSLFSSENGIYIITSKECSSLSSQKNPFHLASANELFSRIGFFYTNSSKNKALSIFKMHSDTDIDLKESLAPFLFSPNAVTYSPESVFVVNGTIVNDDRFASSFEVTGKKTQIKSIYTIRLSEKDCKISVKVDNIGSIPIRLYAGYAVFSEDGIQYDGRNYPFKNSNCILNLVSAKAGDNKIIVDSTPEVWEKNCHLAINAKKDLSDVPNTNLADGKIVNVQELPNGNSEITLSKPLTKSYFSGTKVRVHGKSGDYIYTNKLVLNPGEEKNITSFIAKNENCTQYTPDAFSKGVYYVCPILLAYSTDGQAQNTVRITQLTVSF